MSGRFEINEKHQVLIHAVVVNFLSANINTANKTEAPLDSSE